MLSPESSVEDFAKWWMVDKPFKPPRDAMRYLPRLSGVTLFREGPFQVQMFIAHPHANAPQHRHPNVDVMDIVVTGLAIFNSETADYDKKKRMIHIHQNEMHDAHAGRVGGCFLSVQKWLNGVEPTSVDLDWQGEPMDENHAAELISVGE